MTHELHTTLPVPTFQELGMSEREMLHASRVLLECLKQAAQQDADRHIAATSILIADGYFFSAKLANYNPDLPIATWDEVRYGSTQSLDMGRMLSQIDPGQNLRAVNIFILNQKTWKSLNEGAIYDPLNAADDQRLYVYFPSQGYPVNALLFHANQR